MHTDTDRNLYVCIFLVSCSCLTFTVAVLIDIELMARTGGIRVLLHALAEGPLEMAPLLSAAFLHIIDSPKTRAYLHPGTDLEVCHVFVEAESTQLNVT